MKSIVVIGGGLAGLINAILLARNGLKVTLYEKKAYPFHRVCGEYISNEVIPFMNSEGLLPKEIGRSAIKTFEFSSIRGKNMEMPLDLGGFGISRFQLDHFLARKAREAGAQVCEATAVQNLQFADGKFHLTLSNGQKDTADIVIGAYGKKSVVDTKLQRSFLKHRSPFIGVKYHIRHDYPDDKIALHNFEGGYCGISAIEDGKLNLCYLASRDLLRKAGDIPSMEETILKKNPHLDRIFSHAEFLFDRPEVINEFSFRPKLPVEKHVLMSGDSAGLITPLCGNGMAMAIHSAKVLSELIIQHTSSHHFDRSALEREYTQAWNRLFRKRLWVGRKTQALFGAKFSSEVAIYLMRYLPPFARQVMKNTHGTPF